MTETIPPEATEAFAALAQLVYAGSDAQEVLDAICRRALEIIPGADHTSISTLQPDRSLRSRAASDDVARTMDELETEAGEGPCLDSILEDSVQRDADITRGCTWPQLARLTLERTPVRGMIGYRLQQGSDARSAFNVFSDTPGALTQQSADIGAVLAAFTSVALTAAEQKASAENLRKGLTSNREIGKAMGLIMAAHSVSDEEAFEILRSASTRTNTKLADVAGKVNSSHRHQLP
ncbi:GAF and ANTAR domain-containing protein [Pedococcus sp. 2YAF34]|uniref:GAF and ANTAR domain-containing protein n=1 Tax=Pedococcus sp. 2YAF34 TaxID=3233032 RepID=UPI003F9B9444